ncbi:uncharacterized protein EDB91DRAFT_1250974 [Suillus paluster]|uniref:uncharacterized protein n=1 Tax=Suillus paluster TaxID=48578 RepID=UPI001B86F47C|nr:uncharacterized protein EDB91DRAFT_1250974 [Suillus paluster]KAG1734452.1 hypothetical protein EDB91DRAFT_1250974 [Suillus paluster]
MSARIPGSQAAKVYVHNEMCNYYGYFGLPHVFLTFNPSAAHSPIFQVMYGDHSVDLSECFPCMPAGRVCALRLAQDPVAAADFYEFSFKCLFHFLLGWDFEQEQSIKDGGILGHIRAFYGTTEFTECGALHGHFLIWLEGGMNPSELHMRLRTDSDFQDQFFRFFKAAIHHHLPDVEDSVDEHFEPRIQRPPMPPSKQPEGMDATEKWEVLFMSEVKKCGEVLQCHHCHSVCHKYGNQGCCRFLFLHEVVDASHFDDQTNSVVLMCCDANVNYFNPYILVFCRHNHDIKCILSGKGAKAAMFYISDYITKMDVKTYEVLSLLSRAVARIPKQIVHQGNVVDHGKALLHKCLSQFNWQQQVHAQQAARYIQGFDDSTCSHQTVPMMSSLLLAYVHEQYIRCDTMTPDDHDDDEVEQVQLQIATDKDGKLVEANQIHHYLYCSDALAQMSFYDFCHCVCVETIKSSARMKNTHETRLGVYRRHALKPGHPAHETHELQEHTNEQRGDGYQEFIPRVVGCSIPRRSDATAWALFALAHFKPFSVIVPLLSGMESVISTFQKYSFSGRSRQVMNNWEAIHECEDERDADRLHKKASMTAESKALSTSLGLASLTDDDVEIDMSRMPSHRAEEDFAISQTVLLMQQCQWLTSRSKAPMACYDQRSPIGKGFTQPLGLVKF